MESVVEENAGAPNVPVIK